MKIIDEYLKEVKKNLRESKVNIKSEETGLVQEVRDGVALLSGLDNASFGEIVEFESGVSGYIIDLTDEFVGAIVFGDYLTIKANEQVRSLGYTLSLSVSDSILGRVIDPLGFPQDNLPRLEKGTSYPLEKVAPTVVFRHPVNTSMQTGIKAIDSLIPIGRGQRELIVGDRGTGKTTIAIDTILNQKKQDVVCVYCAIGQKNSKVARVIDLLRKNKAMDYTVVVNASASDSASSQYIAPYAASAISEYFMDKGKDVLVVYDDLTKHAWAYRQISLVLRRPAGREAYPGDIFYLHSRLLERACKLDKKYGGGSITALPIIETLEGDMSGYIPTNIISITDGQLFLETDLFNAGIRPAINVGTSVSRVGGNAQTKAMKQVAGKLKLDLAQYREMAAFSQFESELDEETKQFLNRGARLTQILIQKKNTPYSLAEQVALIWAATKGYLSDLDLGKIQTFEERFLNDLKTRGKKWLERVNKNKILSEQDEKELEKYVKETTKLIR